MVEREAYRELGLTDQEYQNIEKIMGREPSPTEIAMFSVEWSEHCGYPRSRKWLSLFPQQGKYEGFRGFESNKLSKYLKGCRFIHLYWAEDLEDTWFYGYEDFFLTISPIIIKEEIDVSEL